MRPHQSKVKSQSAAVGRARMILKDKLAWVEGFPNRGVWVEVSPHAERASKPMQLDRRTLRSATYAAKKLRGQFPKALPLIVGSADDWFDGIQELLTHVKPIVHGRETRPSNLFATARYDAATQRMARELAEDSRLEPLLRALSWSLLTRKANARRYLRWLADNQDAMAAVIVLDLHTAVRLVHLGERLGARATVPLLDLLTFPQLGQVCTRGGRAFVAATLKQVPIAAGPKPQLPNPAFDELPKHVSEFTLWLLRQEPKVAKRCLRLLDECDWQAVVEQWKLWWRKAQELTRKAASECQRYRYSGVVKQELVKARQTLKNHSDEVPNSIVWARGLEALRFFASSDERGLAVEATKACAALRGKDGEGALHWLVYWYVARNDIAEGRLKAVLQGMGALAVQYGSGALRPWRGLAEEAMTKGKNRYSVEDEVGDEDFPVGRTASAYRGLGQLYQNGGELTLELATRLCEVHSVVADIDRCVELVSALHRAKLSDTYLDEDILKAALALCDGHLQEFPLLFDALYRIEDEASVELGSLTTTLRRAFHGREDLLRLLLTGADRRDVLLCGTRLVLLEELGYQLRLPKRAEPEKDWMKDYPRELHRALGALAAVSPEPGQVAERAVKGTLRGRGALLREKQALQQRLAQGHTGRGLGQRLENLRKRLREPVELSASQWERLDKKLHRAAAREVMAELNANAEARLVPALMEWLGLDEPPDWLLRSDAVALYQPIRALEGGVRTLACELLRLRAGSPPWDLRDHPKNRQFVARMDKRGIRMDAWVDGIGADIHEVHDTSIIVDFCDDPLDVFQMGGHFKTCLSPGRFNFFSVFANTADINKRLIYARDKHGRVLGRCLFALTAAGRLLTFHPYCHDGALEFSSMVDAFANRLCKAMGTERVSRGRVPTLVAEDWYDDGATDVTGQFDFAKDGSPFRKALCSVEPAGLGALLGEHVGELGPGLMPVLVQLHEMRERPELVVALLPWIRMQGELADDVVVAVCSALVATETADDSHFYASRLLVSLERQFAERGWYNAWAAIDLAVLSPSQALRFLLRTRRPGVRSRRDEYDTWRIFTHARALEGLHRPAQARFYYERVVRWSHKSEPVHPLARAGLARLDSDHEMV